MVKTLTIKGMTCNNCVRHTKEALESVPGVTSVNVDLLSNSATIECDNTVQDKNLQEAVTDAGYEITSIN